MHVVYLPLPIRVDLLTHPYDDPSNNEISPNDKIEIGQYPATTKHKNAYSLGVPHVYITAFYWSGET